MAVGNGNGSNVDDGIVIGAVDDRIGSLLLRCKKDDDANSCQQFMVLNKKHSKNSSSSGNEVASGFINVTFIMIFDGFTLCEHVHRICRCIFVTEHKKHSV